MLLVYVAHFYSSLVLVTHISIGRKEDSQNVIQFPGTR